MKPDAAFGAINVPLTVRPFGRGDRAAWASFVQALTRRDVFLHRIQRRDIIERVYRSNPKYQALIQQWRRPLRAGGNGLGPSIVRNVG